MSISESPRELVTKQTTSSLQGADAGGRWGAEEFGCVASSQLLVWRPVLENLWLKLIMTARVSSSLQPGMDGDVSSFASKMLGEGCGGLPGTFCFLNKRTGCFASPHPLFCFDQRGDAWGCSPRPMSLGIRQHCREKSRRARKKRFFSLITVSFGTLD